MRVRIPLPVRLALLAAVAALVVPFVCRGARARPRSRSVAEPSGSARQGQVLVTGYCNCALCCGWRRSWFGLGRPVYASGPLKGRPKQVGVTASGTRARRGTIAADTSVYAFGTRLHVPGYGDGTVEDTGGAIRGRHVDVWFPSHAEARRWGARWLDVTEIGASGERRVGTASGKADGKNKDGVAP